MERVKSFLTATLELTRVEVLRQRVFILSMLVSLLGPLIRVLYYYLLQEYYPSLYAAYSGYASSFAGYLVVSGAFYSLVVPAIYMPYWAIYLAYWNGLIELYMSYRHKLLPYVIAVVLRNVLYNTVSTVLYLVLACLALGFYVNIYGLLLVVLATPLVLVALLQIGLVLSTTFIFLNAKNGPPYDWLISLIMVGLTGYTFPVEFLGKLSGIAYIIPLSPYMELVHEVFLRNRVPLHCIAMLAAEALVYSAIGLSVFKRALEKNAETGVAYRLT